VEGEGEGGFEVDFLRRGKKRGEGVLAFLGVSYTRG
jgi:hypothetical protein